MKRSFVQQIPDAVTLSRLFGTLPALGILFYLSRHPSPTWHVSVTVLVILLTLSDAVDGWLARRFDCVSDLGKHLDPIADKWLAALFVPLVAFNQIHFLPVALLWLRDLATTEMRGVAAKRGQVIAARTSGKVKTAISFTLLCLLVAAMPVPGSPFNFLVRYGANLAWTGGILLTIACVWSGIDYLISFLNRDWQRVGAKQRVLG